MAVSGHAMAPFRDYCVKDSRPRPASRSITTRPTTIAGIRTARTTVEQEQARMTSTSWTITGAGIRRPATSSRAWMRSGFKVNPDILPRVRDGPCGRRNRAPRIDGLSSMRIRSSIRSSSSTIVEILYYRNDNSPTAPETGDDISRSPRPRRRPTCMAGRPRGVKGQPDRDTIAHFEYMGAFHNDDWSPGSPPAGRCGALLPVQLSSPTCRAGVGRVRTDRSS